jgi:hypothetical protein
MSLVLALVFLLLVTFSNRDPTCNLHHMVAASPTWFLHTWRGRSTGIDFSGIFSSFELGLQSFMLENVGDISVC